jgi:5-formyltetrahydrofolate cyclo-ligase
MEEIKAQKAEMRNAIINKLSSILESELKEKITKIENHLFDFANFLEANIILLYLHGTNEVPSLDIIKRCYDYGKMVIIPDIDREKGVTTLLKIDDPEKDLKEDVFGQLEPVRARCKIVPVECIDIAIIPGLVFDEKGGRLGVGDGAYDRLIPDLPATTRKVSLAFEEQLVTQVPTESHDRYVDIIITDRRIIYKI